MLLLSPITLSAEYGVDVSFPMHHNTVSNNYAELEWNTDPAVATPVEYQDMVVQPLGNRQKFYDEMIEGCVKYYGQKGNRCLEYEVDRVEMSLQQPQSMENYTDIGFKKLKAPDNVWKLVKDFWDANKDQQSKESWPSGNTYTNHWAAETRILNVENSRLRGGGLSLKGAIWKAAKNTISEWTGAELKECSLYGIRVYTTGSVLSAHVDRLPLVSSAIINVASDVDEPWPLEVIGHDGKAHNVTMEPGDMVLYESHSIIHARPFPLKGKYVANIFVHFEPVGHSERHQVKIGETDPNEKYKRDTAAGIGGHESDPFGDVEERINSLLPPYIIPGSPEVPNYLESHPESDAAKLAAQAKGEGATSAHFLAADGKLEKLTELIERRTDLVSKPDRNGWTPLHEGVRSGNVEVVRYILSKGVDVNHRTGSGSGYSGLALAHKLHGPLHPITKFLESMGGEVIEPEL